MDMNSTVMFDFRNVSARHNPPSPELPICIDAWGLIGTTVLLDPRRVMPMEGQPRTKLRNISSLAQGIKKDGQKTAILVHPINHPDFDVELQAGERRTRACRDAELMIRAEIRQVPANSKEHFVDAWVENFNREDLTTGDTIRSIQRLQSDSHSLKEIADMAGKSYSWALQYASLTNLHPDVLQLLDELDTDQRDESGRRLKRKTILPFSIAIHVVKIPKDKQPDVVHHILSKGMSIERARNYVEKYLGESGITMRVQKRSPNELFGLLERQVARHMSFLESYLDMPTAELGKIMSAQNPADRRAFARSIKELAMHLNGLAGIVWDDKEGGKR